MLFIVMHKVNDSIQAGQKPSQYIITEMGKLMGEMVAAGKLHNGAGLKSGGERMRVRNAGGAISVTAGPVRGDNELVASFAMLQTKSMDEALSWGKRMAEVIGDVEIEVGPVTERWDLGLMDKPADAPLRTLALRKSDKATEADQQLPADKAAQLDALFGEMQRAGVLLASETLKPSARGARLRTSGGKQSWVDGPFAESKELVAGFAIIRVDSIDEAKAFTTRYANILGDIEVDVREVVEK